MSVIKVDYGEVGGGEVEFTVGTTLNGGIIFDTSLYSSIKYKMTAKGASADGLNIYGSNTDTSFSDVIKSESVVMSDYEDILSLASGYRYIQFISNRSATNVTVQFKVQS